MRKLLATIATPEIAHHCAEFVVNQQGYAEAAGYDYSVSEQLHWTDLAASFSKVWELYSAMEAGYDIVLWADIDVAFMDYSRNLAQLLEPDYFAAAYQQTDFARFKYLCCGLMVWRKTDAALELLREWIRRIDTRHITFHPWEQWIFSELIRETNYAGIRCCSAHEIGCFAPQIWHDGTIWKPGMPTVHFAGPADWPTRRKIFLEHYQHLVKRT